MFATVAAQLKMVSVFLEILHHALPLGLCTVNGKGYPAQGLVGLLIVLIIHGASRRLLHRLAGIERQWAERPGTFRGMKRKRKPLGCGEIRLVPWAPSQQLIALRPSNYVCACCQNGN